jgi:serine/threonine-protein kinase
LERITGVRKNDKRSDIYFAGAILYHMLAGRPPLFETRDRSKRLSVARFRDVPPLGQLVPDLPNYVIAFCNRAMDLKPERRFQSPGEMLEELKRVKSGDRGVHVPDRELAPATEPDEVLAANDSPLELEGDERTIMLVESNVRMQDTIRNALKKRGYRVLVFSSPHRALQRFHDHVDAEPLADCVILSTGELGDEAVDAFNALGEDERTEHMPAILLVNREAQQRVQHAKVDDRRILLPLSVKIKDLRDSLKRLLREEYPSSS